MSFDALASKVLLTLLKINKVAMIQVGSRNEHLCWDGYRMLEVSAKLRFLSQAIFRVSVSALKISCCNIFKTVKKIYVKKLLFL